MINQHIPMYVQSFYCDALQFAPIYLTLIFYSLYKTHQHPLKSQTLALYHFSLFSGFLTSFCAYELPLSALFGMLLTLFFVSWLSLFLYLLGMVGGQVSHDLKHLQSGEQFLNLSADYPRERGLHGLFHKVFSVCPAKKSGLLYHQAHHIWRNHVLKVSRYILKPFCSRYRLHKNNTLLLHEPISWQDKYIPFLNMSIKGKI